MEKTGIIHGVISVMVKNVGESVVEWIWKVFMEAWKSGHVPDGWTKAVIFPQYMVTGVKVNVRIRGMSFEHSCQDLW